MAALPLGGRIKVDPWSDQLQLAKWPEGAMSEAGKMSFQITPFIFYLTRQNDKSAKQTTGGVAVKLDTKLKQTGGNEMPASSHRRLLGTNRPDKR